jgi:ParB/RepB/Spo0J family partition protein
MTTESHETTANDPEAGAHIRLREHLTDDGGAPSKFAGMYGTIYGRDPFGGYLLKIGAKTMHFARADFIVVAEPSAEQLAGAIAQGAAHEATQAPATHHHINLVEVHPLQAINSPTNPRRRRGLDVDSLRTMADSLATHGLMQPIVVRPLPASRVMETSAMDPRPAYELIAGERRWRAAQLAELATMPMLVRELSDEAVLELQLVENIEREDLDAMEEAEGFALLRDKLGYTVEQIAERMGKGRGPSYVRKRMKLLDLTPASREAMYDGTLQLSTGLLVARYPAERQAEVVKYIASLARKTTTGAEPMPFREVSSALYRKFNTLLGTAAFDTTDPTLVVHAGACSACPKRSGAHLDLFEGPTDAGADSCLDTACWAEKKAAHVQRIHADAKARGLQVLDDADAEKVFPNAYSSFPHDYTPVTGVAYTETGNDGQERDVTYADLLRAQGRKALKPIIVINPHTSKAAEMIPDELAAKLLPKEQQLKIEQKQQRTAASRQPVVDTRPPELLALLRHDVKRAVLLRAFDAIRTNPRSVGELRLIARNVWEADPELTERYLGWTPEIEGLEYEEAQKLRNDKINAMDADQLAQAITMGALEFEVDSNMPHRNAGGDVNTRALEAVGIFGIDILAVQAKVDEDLERQRAAAGDGGSTEGDEQDEDAEEAA